MDKKTDFQKWRNRAVGFCLLLLFTSFQSEKCTLPAGRSALGFDEIEKYVQKINLLKEKKQLSRYFYPDMTIWGSAAGYWLKSNIVFCESQFNAEAGYTKMDIYYNKDEVWRIITEKHIANWAEYERNHGSEAFDISKVTFTDEQYDLTFGKELVLRRFDGKQMIPVTITDTAWCEGLKASAMQMQEFLYENGVK